MTRLMYDGIMTDAVTIARLKPAIVAYYIDGRYAWSEKEIALFPHSAHVTITVLGSVAADVADCETGDLTPAHAAQWVRNKRARGYIRPTIYCSLSAIPSVRRATAELLLGVDYDIWVAKWDGSQTDPYPLVVAKQYRTTAGYDESIVYDPLWPHRTIAAPDRAYSWPAGVTLQKGSKGAAVRVLQTAFHNSGIHGVRGIAEDGDFGPQTQTATRNFEAAEKLTLDAGIAGKQVRDRLISLGLITKAGEYTGG